MVTSSCGLAYPRRDSLRKVDWNNLTGLAVRQKVALDLARKALGKAIDAGWRCHRTAQMVEEERLGLTEALASMEALAAP
jgi:hypothetical protein